MNFNNIQLDAFLSQAGNIRVQGAVFFKQTWYIEALEAFCTTAMLLMNLEKDFDFDLKGSHFLDIFDHIKSSIQNTTIDRLKKFIGAEERLQNFIQILRSSKKHQKEGEEIEKLYQDLLSKASST